jgi:hypothetical protein
MRSAEELSKDAVALHTYVPGTKVLRWVLPCKKFPGATIPSRSRLSRWRLQFCSVLPLAKNEGSKANWRSSDPVRPLQQMAAFHMRRFLHRGGDQGHRQGKLRLQKVSRFCEVCEVNLKLKMQRHYLGREEEGYVHRLQSPLRRVDR